MAAKAPAHDGYIYILHFHTPLATGRKSSQHYVGWSRHWAWRIGLHRAGAGARIMEVCADRGISFDVATVALQVVCGGRSYTGPAAERQIKRSHHIARYCPRCGGRGADDYRTGPQAAQGA